MSVCVFLSTLRSSRTLLRVIAVPNLSAEEGEFLDTLAPALLRNSSFVVIDNFRVAGVRLRASYVMSWRKSHEPRTSPGRCMLLDKSAMLTGTQKQDDSQLLEHKNRRP